MRSRVLLALLAGAAAASVGAAWSQGRRLAPGPGHGLHEAHAPRAAEGGVSGAKDMGPHMRVTAARQPRPGDDARAGLVVERARRAVEKYQDYRAALGDGFEIMLPDVPQKMYHFNNAAHYAEAEREFDAERPTSLLYEKAPGGYRLIGLMYTAAAGLSEEELDRRIPLSVARWHQHVNVCLPEGDPLQNLFGGGPRLGLEGSITTAGECREAGGRFYPRLFGWMVHLYPYERTPEAMWSVERQMGEGAHHAH